MIKELGLNKFPEQLFRAGEDDAIRKFLKKYPAEYYAIRDKSKAGGVFKLSVLSDKVLDEIEDYELFTINVSSINYADNQLLVGEIEILSNGDVYAILSTGKGDSVRDALRKPTYNLKTNIFDNKLNEIHYFDIVCKYIIDNELWDVIVEFALFDKNVGIINEKIIIYELRTDY